jgi:hypothetical protein
VADWGPDDTLTDHRHCRLLRARRERPRSHRSAEQRDGAPFHTKDCLKQGPILTPHKR